MLHAAVAGKLVKLNTVALLFIAGFVFDISFRQSSMTSCSSHCSTKHCSAVNATKCYLGDEYELCVEPIGGRVADIRLGRPVSTSGWNTILPAPGNDADQLASLLPNPHQLNEFPVVPETDSSDWPADCRMSSNQDADKASGGCPDVIPVSNFNHVILAGASHERPPESGIEKCNKCQCCPDAMTSLSAVAMATPGRDAPAMLSTFAPQNDCSGSRSRTCVT